MADIRTNNQPRKTLRGYELTEQERKEFDYLDWSDANGGGQSAEFFRYKGQLYDLGEVVRCEPGGELETLGWEGICSQSAFHAVIIKLVSEDQVVVGQIFS